MAIFSRNPSDDDSMLPDDDWGVDGLPDGVETPPVPRLPDIDWQTDVTENARLGIPGPGFPSRPLPFEEAAVNLFNADMRELTKWGTRQRTVLAALHEMASTRCNGLERERNRVDGEIADAEAAVVAQRDQLSEQELKYPRLSGAVNGSLVVGTALAAGLETIALQPVIGAVFATQDWKAWGFAGLAVGAIGYSSWQFGGLLHRWLAYEGPRRIRRALGLKALGFGTFAVLSLVGVVGIRLLGRNDRVTSIGEAIFAGFLYAAVQGLVQLAAMTHGWRHENPRVRELANTEAQLAQLRLDRDAVDDARGDAETWAESLDEFHVGDWLTEHRAQIAEDYAAAVHHYRNKLGQALIDNGHDESADVLHILPLPKFVPPIESDPDDSRDWVNGFILPL